MEMILVKRPSLSSLAGLSFAVVISALSVVSARAQAADTLVILSPHRKSIQEEFVPRFKEYYQATFKTPVEVDWLDQGGTSDDVRFLKAKFEKTPATAGIDVFWGGGTATFLDLSKAGLLAPVTLPAALAKEVPDNAAGIPLYDGTKTWYASAMSSFGIFWNKKVAKIEGLPEPKTWDDLGDAKYRNQLVVTDPRKSGTANTMNNIVLQSHGWDKGWELLSRIAGNTRQFTQSSSDPVKAVVSGDATASMVIDFYATPKINELGADNLGFNIPASQSVIDPDPVGVVKGAPNAKVAQRFIEWVLSADAQQILLLPKGAAGGPKLETLGRMAVNTGAYAATEGKRLTPFNPFKAPAFMKYDLAKAAKMQAIFNDLIGAIHVDVHTDVKAAWEAVVKRGAKAEEVAEFSKPPVTEAELVKMSDQWTDDVFRNKTINAWVEGAKAKYKKLGKGAS
jgi:ABC-type Fe3+ transport system substrate-binding protein